MPHPAPRHETAAGEHAPSIVLGIDTSLRSTGIGVVEVLGTTYRHIAHDTLKTPRTAPLSECLRIVHEGVAAAIVHSHPTAVSIEGAFLGRNIKTAMILGEARGAAIAACAIHGLPVFEYAPRRVKQALVGYGSADKSQVRRMVMTLLNMKDEPQEDAGDALAIAICHLQSQTRFQALAPLRI